MKLRILFALIGFILGAGFMRGEDITSSLKCGSSGGNIMFIEAGTKWEIKVTNHESSFNVAQWLDEEIEIGDKTYLKLWSEKEGEVAEVICYIRIDQYEDRVYALPIDADEEILIYSFGSKAEVTPITWDGKIVYDHTVYMQPKKSEFIYNCGYQYHQQSFDVYAVENGEKRERMCSVIWYRGLGNPSGFLNQIYSMFSFEVMTELERVIHCDGTVVYDRSSASIDAVNHEDTSGAKKYKLDGTEFHEGEKGIYILNGKKYVSR